MGFDLSKLGVKTNVPKVDFREYSGLFQSVTKFGKTQFAALMPKSILVAFEKGYDAQVVDYIDCTSDKTGWDDFIEFIDNLEDNREEIGNEIKLIIIDTAEECYKKSEPYMLKRESKKDGKKYEYISDIAHGNGYARKDEYFRKQIKRLYDLGFKPLYLTHSELKTIRPKDKNIEPYEVYVATLPDRCARIIYPEVSYIINGIREKKNDKLTRILQVQGSDESPAGNRVYFDEDIAFNSEEEAIEKFENKFKEMIKKRLLKHGIKDDIEKLAKKQDKEKMAQVKQYIKDSKLNEFSNSDLVDEIKEITKSLTKTLQTDAMNILKFNKITSLKDPDSLVEADLTKALGEIKKLKEIVDSE